jgi:hypothetical protein
MITGTSDAWARSGDLTYDSGQAFMYSRASAWLAGHEQFTAGEPARTVDLPFTPPFPPDVLGGKSVAQIGPFTTSASIASGWDLVDFHLVAGTAVLLRTDLSTKTDGSPGGGHIILVLGLGNSDYIRDAYGLSGDYYIVSDPAGHYFASQAGAQHYGREEELQHLCIGINHGGWFAIYPKELLQARITANDGTTRRLLGLTLFHTGFLMATAHSPLTLVLTDPQGRRTGVRPDGSLLEEIPGAAYQPSEGEDQATGERVVVPEGPQSILVTGQAPGLYRLDVVGTGHGPYTIDWSHAGPDGTILSRRTESGTISPGERKAMFFTTDGLPIMRVSDMAVAEGDEGATLATFAVDLSAPASQPVTVNYSTANGTATAGTDYVAVAGTLTFAPGETRQIITVPINTNTIIESDKTFLVNLAEAAGAALAIAQATGTIVNDDPAASIGDTALPEGQAGSVAFVFPVTLSTASTQTITVSYSTANATATAGRDYEAQTGTLVFSPGETSKTITILVSGDTLFEPDGTFLVSLTAAGNARIAKGVGVGTILNDDPPLAVSAFQSTPSGFHVEFNGPVEVKDLNLYDAAPHQRGAPDVTLVGATTGPVVGTLLVDPAGTTITFVRTGGVLPPDTYTVVVRSASDGFRNLAGQLLDGDGDGTPGGDYVTSFAVNPSGALVVGVVHFAAGPGQIVNVPFDSSGIPVTLSDGSGVTSVELSLAFDPELLTIESIVLGAALPPGATLEMADLSRPGLAVVSLVSPTPLGTGQVELLRFTAVVPPTAAYTSMNLLSFATIRVNGGAIPAIGGDAVHLVAYPGDTTGNGAYTSLDAQRILRIAAGLDTGFGAYPLTDPALVGDLIGNGGVIDSLDAMEILQEAIGLDRPEIPPLPRR